MKNRRLLINQSGGTTTAINATTAGIISAALHCGFIDSVWGSCNGIRGVLEGKYVDLTDLTSVDLDELALTPGSAPIGTTRVGILDDKDITRIAQQFDSHDIGHFINIGGNGTIRQTVSIWRGLYRHGYGDIRIVALPKTVDNDLGDPDFDLVYYTPGFPSCVNYWQRKVRLLDEENRGAATSEPVLVAQTFGRETGFLAGCARLADPERKLPLLLLMPEDQQSEEKWLSAVDGMLRISDRAIVIISEGYHTGDIGSINDPSGQIMYGSCRTTSAQQLVNRLNSHGITARSFIPTVDQRLENLFSASEDVRLARELGVEAVRYLRQYEGPALISLRRPMSGASLWSVIRISDAGNLSRKMPKAWIRSGQFDVTDDYVDYLSSIVSPELWKTSPYRERLATMKLGRRFGNPI